MKFGTAVLVFVFGIFGISLFLVALGLDMQEIDFVINFIIPLLLGLILSALIDSFVKAFGLEFLEDIPLNIQIWEINISVPLSVIIAFLIKMAVF